MPKRKRLQRDPDNEPSGPANSLPPRKSARHATNSASPDDGSSEPSNSTDNDRSREKVLSDAVLIQEVSKMAENKGKAELMILELMRKYTFDLSRLRELLGQNNLNVCFSRVQYADIAPLVGLDPTVEAEDIPTFEMFRARLPSQLFPLIVDDLQMFETQYGPMSKHRNEEARSRYLSGYFNRIVRLFSGLLFNTPEAILEGRLTTKGRIEYQFKTYGGVTVVFIEVKLQIGNSTELLNCVAQVIAECDACAWQNYQNGYHLPIMAILCDGKHFLFYKFVDKRPANGSPQLYLGVFPNGDRGISIDDISLRKNIDAQAFYRNLRGTCDALYYIFLRGYQAGLEAYWNRSVERGRAEGKGRDSTPGWLGAKIQAKEALEEATYAWNLYDEGRIEESKEAGDRAVKCLAESVKEAPFVPESILPKFSEGMEDM